MYIYIYCFTLLHKINRLNVTMSCYCVRTGFLQENVSSALHGGCLVYNNTKLPFGYDVCTIMALLLQMVQHEHYKNYHTCLVWFTNPALPHVIRDARSSALPPTGSLCVEQTARFSRRARRQLLQSTERRTNRHQQALCVIS